MGVEVAFECPYHRRAATGRTGPAHDETVRRVVPGTVGIGLGDIEGRVRETLRDFVGRPWGALRRRIAATDDADQA